MRTLNTLTLIILLAGSIVTVAAQSAGWTPAGMMDYKRVGSPSISPDGKLVAYTVASARMDGENSDFLTHVYVAGADGKWNVQYTFGDKSCSNPQFSPDGQSLAFLSGRGKDGKSQIFVMRLAGGEAQQVSNAKNGVNSFAWSPDGKRFAFTMTDTLPAAEEKGRKEKKDWTVVDTYQKAQLFTVSLSKDAKGEYPIRRLTRESFHVTSFDWSPDGKTLVFAHQPSPMADFWTGSDLSTVPADSGAVKVLYSAAGGDAQPKYSPDGRWIAFSSTNGSQSWMQENFVMVIPAAGGAPKKLAATPDQSPGIVDWAADGSAVVVTESFRTGSALYSVPAGGGPVKKLTKKDSGLYGGFDMNARGELAYTYQTTSMPPDVYVSNTAFATESRLTDIHSEFVKGRTAAPTELMSWKSKDGKYDIEGLLTYPANYQRGRKYPLILIVHGGPAGVFSQTYTGASSVYPIQAFASQGYFVLRANPRGSGGYGADFRRANYRDWGNNDYDDLMAGVDKTIELGLAHPDSLCESGWSYGGYMTSMIITKTDRFKAVMAGAPVTNLMSFNGTADIPSFLPSYFGGEFWEDQQEYEDHSAMFHIKNAKTPTLIIHGQADDRVPPEQGFQLHRALQRLGVPTKMVTYPRQPHGFTEPKFIQDVGERVTEWFNKYVGKTEKAKP